MTDLLSDGQYVYWTAFEGEYISRDGAKWYFYRGKNDSMQWMPLPLCRADSWIFIKFAVGWVCNVYEMSLTLKNSSLIMLNMENFTKVTDMEFKDFFIEFL